MWNDNFNEIQIKIKFDETSTLKHDTFKTGRIIYSKLLVYLHVSGYLTLTCQTYGVGPMTRHGSIHLFAFKLIFCPNFSRIMKRFAIDNVSHTVYVSYSDFRSRIID